MPEPTFILEDILLKEPTDITDPGEVKFLQEHKADLSPEEQDYFKSALEPAAPAAPEPPAAPDDVVPTFKTKAEFDTYIEDKAKEIAKTLKPEPTVPEPPAAPEPPTGEPVNLLKKLGVKFDFKFEKDPENWSDFAKQYSAQVFPQLADAFTKLNQVQRQEMIAKIEGINQRFDEEIVDIRAKNSDIPKKGTKEGDTWERELAATAQKYKGVTSMNEAYEIWKATKGAAAPAAPAPATPPVRSDTRPPAPNPLAAKQRLAANVPGGGTPPNPAAKPKSYKDIAGQSMDDIIAAATEALEKGE